MNTQAHDAAKHLRMTSHGGITEASLGIQRVGADPLGIFNGFPRISDEVVAQWVFGGCRFHEAALASMGPVCWPLMWLQGDRCNGKHVAGLQAFLLRGTPVRRLELDGRVVGSVWSDDEADYCWLAGILPSDLTSPRGAQTRQVFERMESVLNQAGMDFLDVVRTWLYLDELLEWYGEFNQARTGFFEERGVFRNRVPASTGIGASNPHGAALVAGALAVRPRRNVKISVIPSPLQCEATDYQSSFSRAMELEYPDRRLLTISGTASIAPGGESMYRDDMAAQIELTMRVVHAILASRGMTWRHTTRAIAYFQDMTTAPLLDEYCRKHGIVNFPVVNAHATVCRDDLLFEIELDAAVTQENRPA